MAKALRTVAIVAGSIALIATGVGAIAGSATLIAGVSVGTIAATASAVATTASIGATALQKKPPAQGSLNQVLIGNNLPIPYAMGRTYVPGLMIYDDSGGTDNRYRFQINVITAAGPIDSIEQRLVDFNNTTFVSGEAQGWYANFLSWQDKLGTRPDTAFTSGGTAIPGWGANHKLSGYAAYRAKMLFDKDAKRFSSGVPQFGVVGKMVLVYDPRLDSTYPGGSGPHRWNDESTWTWSENPGLHALAYARGRFIEKTAAGAILARPIKICGIGYSKDGIDIPTFVELANLCTANGWKVGGTVYEAPGSSKWDNLKRICQAGGAIPTFSGGMLTLKLSAPRPSLFTITADDLAGPVSVRSAKSWRERKNSIVPRYRSEAHKWEYVQGKEVTASTYLTEDGELKSEEIQFDLVQDLTQATELAAYALTNGRELGPITLTLKPRLLAFRIGEGGVVNIPEAGLANQAVVIVGRQVDIASGTVTLTFETETAAKHAYALGQTGEAPPTPVLRTSQELDEAATDLDVTVADIGELIKNSYAKDLTFGVTSAGAVTISGHNRVYSDKAVAVNSGSLSLSVSSGDLVLVYYDDPERDGGAVTYAALVVPAAGGPTEDAYVSPDHPYRHFVAVKSVPASGTASGGTNYGSGGGGGGWSGSIRANVV